MAADGVLPQLKVTPASEVVAASVRAAVRADDCRREVARGVGRVADQRRERQDDPQDQRDAERRLEQGGTAFIAPERVPARGR